MTTITVPTRQEVSSSNQAIFDQLEKGLGFVPNLYATLAHNDTALGDYLTLQNRKSTLKAKEKEVVNLAVSQVNECVYCLAAHTAISKMNGFSDNEILDIRANEVTWDSKTEALANLAHDTTINRGKPSAAVVEAFFAAGYTKAQLIDTIVLIGDKIITNYLHGITQIPVDFPAAPELEQAAV